MFSFITAIAFTKIITLFAAFDDQCALGGGKNFFGFPHWWKYISVGREGVTGACEPVLNISGRPYEIWAIVLAIIDMLLRLGGMVAVVYVLIGGIQYVASAGNPEVAKGARTRIINGLTGVVLLIAAIGFVTFLGNRISP